ncbi:MAG: hypothetical protein R3D67_09915 [Hyphomicrobiaceae bacterium]
MMARLAGRMHVGGEIWQSSLGGAAHRDDNVGLPSGYHLPATIYCPRYGRYRGVARADVPRACRRSLQNGRRNALMLDGLYGEGPAECPHLYAVNEIGTASDAPRTRLRIRKLPPDAAPAQKTSCPAADFIRMPSRFDVIAADPRNDFHPIIAQITVLFAMLHNWVAAAIDPNQIQHPIETRWHEHLCARSVVTLIYRTIIERDLLPRLLHPSVAKAYRGASTLSLDPRGGVSARVHGRRLPVRTCDGAGQLPR